MKKTYTPSKNGKYFVNGISQYLTTSDSILISEEKVPGQMIINDDWKTISSEVDDSGLEVVKTIEEVKVAELGKNVDGSIVYGNRSKFVSVTVTNKAGADDLVVGSALVLQAKDVSGTVLQTMNHTFKVLAAEATETFVTKFDGITSNIADIVATITYSSSASEEVAKPTMVVEVSEVSNISNGALFTEGASVAATNAIVTAVQLVDKNGVAITNREVVEVFVLTDLDTPAGASALTIGTDGKVIGTMTANNTILALSEVDGSIDVSVTKTAAGSLRFGIKTSNGSLSVSDYLIWTA